MPIYEYQCKDCGKISEFLEGVGKDKIEKVCRHCDTPPCSDNGICRR
ncbi:FmdB family zinc ribbon protein [Candidatus Omnitrophota bacterium]